MTQMMQLTGSMIQNWMAAVSPSRNSVVAEMVEAAMLLALVLRVEQSEGIAKIASRLKAWIIAHPGRN